MLRAYVIPCGTIGDRPLTPDDEVALTHLIDAIHTRVTLVLSKTELVSLLAAVERLSSSLNRDRLRERLLHDRANDGPGLQVIDTSKKLGARTGLVKSLFRAGRVDAVLGRSSGGRRRQPAFGAAETCCGFLDAARQIGTMPIERGLCEVSQEDELASVFQPLFRFGEEIAIIDPYLAPSVFRDIHGAHFHDTGLRFITEIAAKASVVHGSKLRITVVCCRQKLEDAIKKLKNAKGGGDPEGSGLPTLDAAIKQVGERLSQRLGGYAQSLGIPLEKITIKWFSAYSDRGFVSSRRVWRVEHSLQSLTELIDCIRKGKKLPGNKVRLQILQDAGAAEIRRLVFEAHSPGSGDGVALIGPPLMRVGAW